MTDRLRLCFVSHRAMPFPGGTEVFVQAMASAAQARGHQVCILAGQHQGDFGGIPITSDETILDSQPFDLVIVHGATEGPPRRTLDRAAGLRSPVLYMVVAHYAHHVRRRHLLGARVLGWSSPLDRRVIAAHGLQGRARRVRHGLRTDLCLGAPGFRQRHGIAPDRRMFLSCGGYGANKRMRALAALFERSQGDALLVTTGYSKGAGMPRQSDRVLPLLIEDPAEVLSAIFEADCYLMHSRDEGFGLVMLEAMVNRTPWIAHATGGAPMLTDCGTIYHRSSDLIGLIDRFSPDPARIAHAHARVMDEFDIRRTVEDIEAAARLARSPAPPPERGGVSAQLALWGGRDHWRSE